MTDAMERRVEAALRAWGQAAMPTDDTAGVGAREKKTVGVVQRALAGVAQRRRHRAAFRRWGVPFASAAACLGLLFGGALWYRGLSQGGYQVASGQREFDSTYAEVRAVDGGVVARRDGAAELLRDGATVRIGPGDMLSTPPDGRAQVGLDEGGRIELASATELAIPNRIPGVERFNLNLGRVSVDVPPNPNRTRIVVVETPDVAVTVHGTSFVVDVHELPGSSRPITSVAVSRGTVWIMREGHRIAVIKAGGSWSSAAKSRGISHGESESALENDAIGPSESGASGRGGAFAKRHVASVALRRSVSVNEVPGNASVATELAESEAAPAATDIAAGGPVASDRLRRENRQFQAALKERNAGNDRGAIVLLDGFLRSFPGSVLAQEVRVERFRAMKRLGLNHDAEQAARQYLADYDDGFARSEARDIALAPDGGVRSPGRERKSQSR